MIILKKIAATVSLLLFIVVSLNAQNTQNPWHLIVFENEREVACYNVEVITGFKATGQSVTVKLDNGMEFSHPTVSTTFSFDPRQEGSGTVNERIAVPQWTVYYSNGRLHFNGTVNDIAVFSVNGALAARFAGSHTEAPVSLPSGIYIVHADGKGAKLIVDNNHSGTMAQAEIITRSSGYIPVPVSLQTDEVFKVYWNIITAKNSISIAIPDVENFYFKDENSIMFTMKNGDTNEVVDYRKSKFAIDPILSDDEITFNLSQNGSNDPDLLIGIWELVEFAYTADGKKITNSRAIADVTLSFPERYKFIRISDDDSLMYNPTHLFDCDDVPLGVTRWFTFVTNYLFYIISADLITYWCGYAYLVDRHITDEGYNVLSALRNAYSFVSKDNELIVYFKHKEDPRYFDFKGDENLLILKKSEL
jgi:hypothetical protein